MLATAIYPKTGGKVFLLLFIAVTLLTGWSTASAQSDTEITPEVSLLSVRFEPKDSSYSVEIAVPHPELFTKLDLSLWNQEGHEISRQALVTILHNQTVSLTAPGFINGQTYRLEVYGYGLDGSLISANNTGSSLAEREFVHDPNIAGVQISKPLFTFDSASDQLFVDLETVNSDQIFAYRTVFIESDSNNLAFDEVLQDQDKLPGTAKLTIDAENLSAGQFEIEIQALDSSLNPIVSLDAQWENPASAPVISPLALNYDFEIPEVQVNFQLENGNRVHRYRLMLVDSQTNDVVFEKEAAASESPPIAIPLDGVPAGEYRITLDALNETGRILTSAEGVTSYQPPSPPGFLSRLSRGLFANPLVLLFIVFILLLVMIALFAFWLWSKRSSGTPVLQAGGLEIPEFQSLAFNRTIIPEGPTRNQSTKREAGSPPRLTITVKEYPDKSWRGKKFQVTLYPYSIGRIDSDLELNADASVSRQHSEILFADGVLSIVDKGSSNGTYVNGNKLQPGKPFRINTSKDTRISLGSHTAIILSRD